MTKQIDLHNLTAADFSAIRANFKRTRAKLDGKTLIGEASEPLAIDGTAVVLEGMPPTEAAPGKASKFPARDLDTAAKFLHMLDPDAQAHTFFTITDSKAVKPGDKQKDQWHGRTKLALARLDQMNLAGHGVFVTINRTDGSGGRTKENFDGFRFVWADMDGAPMPKSWPIPPTMVVETSPGKFHVYWKISGEIDDATWAGVMQALVARFGADANATDKVRVLRVPGFVHQKNPAKPFLSRLVSTSDAAYTADELVAAFPVVETKASTSQRASASIKRPDGPRAPWDANEAREALGFVPADCEYQAYFEIVVALKRWSSGSDEGKAVARDWAATSEKFDASEFDRRWERDDGDKGYGASHIRRVATEGGWPGRAVAPFVKRPAASSTTDGTTTKLQETWPVKNNYGNPARDAIANVVWFLEKSGVQVWFNEFDLRYYALVDERLVPVADDVVRKLWGDMNFARCAAPIKLVHESVKYMGHQNPRHPVREYLDGLEWDGVPRIDSLLPEYLAARDTELHRAYGSKWMIAGVRRIRKPGVKFDAMLTLVGAQGSGKSTFFRTLASDQWFTDSVDVGDAQREVIEQTGGSWIVECAELSGMGRRDIESVKSFVTRQTDRARAAHAHLAQDVPRQFVMGATTNQEKFLKDETGNRRFWCVKVGETQQEALRRDRDQLWAEAAYREAQGEDHNIARELFKASTKAAEDFREEDPIEDAIATELGEIERACMSDSVTVTGSDLFIALGYADIGRRGGQVGRAVTGSMKAAGWTQQRKRMSAGSNAVIVWVKGDGLVHVWYDAQNVKWTHRATRH